MSYPGYIHEIPLNYAAHPDFMGSPNFIDFAIEQGWFDPEQDEAFNVTLVYGVDERYPRSAMEANCTDRSALDDAGGERPAHLEGLHRLRAGRGAQTQQPPGNESLVDCSHRLGHFALYPLPNWRAAHRTPVWQTSVSDQG